jgi:hypothetical protein
MHGALIARKALVIHLIALPFGCRGIERLVTGLCARVNKLLARQQMLPDLVNHLGSVPHLAALHAMTFAHRRPQNVAPA